MASLLEKLGFNAQDLADNFRLTDYPMHYFAAIQVRNQANTERVLGSIGLVPHEWRILAALRSRKGQKIGEIAEITALDRFKVSRVVARLTEKGFVVRMDPESDRRQVRLILTALGQAKFEEALGLIKEVYASNLDGVSEDELELLMRLLRRIKDNVYRVEQY